MQLLAIDGGFVTLFSGIQGTLLAVAGVAIAVGVTLFVAARNNYFVKRNLNKLTKELVDVNEQIKLCKDNVKMNKLLKQREKLEKDISAKLVKAHTATKHKDKRLNKFRDYLEQHAQKYPNLLNTFGEDVKTLQDLFNKINEDDNNQKGEAQVTTLDEVDETPTLQHQVVEDSVEVTTKTATQTNDPLSADGRIFHSDEKTF